MRHRPLFSMMPNRYDTAMTTVNQLARGYAMGHLAGTRGVFFAPGTGTQSDSLYVCHRGFNRIVCPGEEDLAL